MAEWQIARGNRVYVVAVARLKAVKRHGRALLLGGPVPDLVDAVDDPATLQSTEIKFSSAASAHKRTVVIRTQTLIHQRLLEMFPKW